MPITRCTKKPVTVRMCGPWDGTDASLAEMRAFVGDRTTDGRPGFIRPTWTVTGEGAARVWDRLHGTWVNVLIGQYVVEGVHGEFYPIDPAVRAETYDISPAG